MAVLARHVKATTVKQCFKGLKNHHHDVGYKQFGDPVEWRALWQMLKGITRAKQDVTAKKQPITPGMLLELRGHLRLAAD